MGNFFGSCGLNEIAGNLHRTVSAVRNRAKRLHVRIARGFDTAAPRRSFQIGQRVRLSTLGAERCPRMKSQLGHIIAKGSGHSYYVLFDGLKSDRQLHCTYIEDGEVDAARAKPMGG